MVLFGSISWEMTSLSDKYTSDRFSSSEAKYCCYSHAWLLFWNPACVEFKRCSFHKFLYYNTKNVLKLDRVLSLLGFLRQYLHTSV